MEVLTAEFIEKNIPKLGFGCMRLPLDDLNDAKSVNIEKTAAMADRYMASGMNYFDTAYMYHGFNGENAVREAVVRRFDRKSFLLAEMSPVWMASSPSDLERIFNEQLKKCGADYFDFYMLHSMGRENEAKALELGAYEFIRGLKKKGAARFVGMSFHDEPEALEEILERHPEIEFVQLQINYMDWHGDMRADECYRIATERGKPVIVMEPVRGGFLADPVESVSREFNARRPGKSAAWWALRFCASLPGVATVLSGMSDMEQMEDNIRTIETLEPLDSDELGFLKETAAEMTRNMYIPCTQCQYCSECPTKIPISAVFGIENEFRRTNNYSESRERYLALGSERSPARCVECGLCEEACPQRIPIIKNLRTTAARFA
jgi:predicted aldo/keto reductase-like oxidoreductase